MEQAWSRSTNLLLKPSCFVIKSKNELGTVGIPDSNNGKRTVFLINTGQVGNAQPLVQHFLKDAKKMVSNMLRDKFKK